MKPEVGTIVHYVGLGIRAETLAAIVAMRIDDVTANLMVVEQRGIPYSVTKVPYDPKGSQGTWHFVSDLVAPPAATIKPSAISE